MKNRELLLLGPNKTQMQQQQLQSDYDYSDDVGDDTIVVVTDDATDDGGDDTIVVVTDDAIDDGEIASLSFGITLEIPGFTEIEEGVTGQVIIDMTLDSIMTVLTVEANITASISNIELVPTAIDDDTTNDGVTTNDDTTTPD